METIETWLRANKRKLIAFYFLAPWILGFACGFAERAYGAEIRQWSRVKGKVIALDHKTNTLTILDRDGYPLTLKLDGDASLAVGKEAKALKDLELGDAVTVTNSPKAPAPVEEGAGTPPGGWK